MNCRVIDDEEYAIDILKHYIDSVPFLTLLASTTNPLEALQLMHQHQIDLAFFDIQMPELSGLDLVLAVNGQFKIMLTTAYSAFASE